MTRWEINLQLARRGHQASNKKSRPIFSAFFDYRREGLHPLISLFRINVGRLLVETIEQHASILALSGHALYEEHVFDTAVS